MKQCVICNKFLRKKKNDFNERLSCYECYGKYRYNTNKLKKLYPKKSFLMLYKDYKVKFGKYRGKTYNDISKDEDYCKWLLTVMKEKDNTLLKYLRHIYNI